MEDFGGKKIRKLEKEIKHIGQTGQLNYNFLQMSNYARISSFQTVEIMAKCPELYDQLHWQPAMISPFHDLPAAQMGL